MADRYAGFKGEGDYATTSAARRGLERAIAKAGPMETIEAKEVIKPRPNEKWCYRAKEIWALASCDEAVDLFSSGDWLHLKMVCDLYDDMLTGKTRYSAQSMEVVMTTLSNLRLTDRAKRQDNIVVDRSEPEVDPVAAIHADVAAMFEEDDDD